MDEKVDECWWFGFNISKHQCSQRKFIWMPSVYVAKCVWIVIWATTQPDDTILSKKHYFWNGYIKFTLPFPDESDTTNCFHAAWMSFDQTLR